MEGGRERWKREGRGREGREEEERGGEGRQAWRKVE